MNEKQSVPYTLDEMRGFLNQCSISKHDPVMLQTQDVCRDCSEKSPQLFDYCGICNTPGCGFVIVPENNLIYQIKERPCQINSQTWILLSNNDALRDTVDDRDWALIFNEEDRRWHNYGLIKLPNENLCPDCDCQYAYEYDRTQSSTPYECFQCGTRFSF